MEGAQKLEDKPQHEMARLPSPLVPVEVDHKIEISSELGDNSNFGHELSHYGEVINLEEQISRKRKINFPYNSEEVKNFGEIEELGVRLAFKKDSQVEIKSLDPLHHINSGPTTSAIATDINLGANIETGNII